MYKIFLLLLLLNFPFAATAQTGKIKLGIDLVVDNDFEIFRGKRLAILSNNAGRSSNKKLTVELFVKSKKCKVVAIFAPEHGFKTWVRAGRKVKDDSLFGLPVYSLYGKNRRPQKYQLDNVDMVIIDLQDIGIRSYTYISSMYNMMDACAEWGIPVVILDRPNPMSGLVVDGNTPDPGMQSFVGIIPVAYVHGCTIGELAQMINEEGWLPKDHFGKPRKSNLSIIAMENWQRWMVWEDTGLFWTPTSPNIPTTNAVRGCAMMGIFGELGLFPISLGVKLPFQYFGRIKFDNIQPIIDSVKFPGIVLEPVFRKKTTGIRLKFEYDLGFAPYTSGIRLFLAVKKLQPELFNAKKVKSSRKKMFAKVTGTKKLFDALFGNANEDEVIKIAAKGLEKYKKIREKYLIYE
jgi:uncharacterized protein YbbC (DUF1343 family)